MENFFIMIFGLLFPCLFTGIILFGVSGIGICMMIPVLIWDKEERKYLINGPLSLIGCFILLFIVYILFKLCGDLNQNNIVLFSISIGLGLFLMGGIGHLIDKY